MPSKCSPRFSYALLSSRQKPSNACSLICAGFPSTCQTKEFPIVKTVPARAAGHNRTLRLYGSHITVTVTVLLGHLHVPFYGCKIYGYVEFQLFHQKMQFPCDFISTWNQVRMWLNDANSIECKPLVAVESCTSHKRLVLSVCNFSWRIYSGGTSHTTSNLRASWLFWSSFVFVGGGFEFIKSACAL